MNQHKKATIPVVLLPTIVAYTISIHLSIQPCLLSSKVGSIVQFFCLNLPCIAPLCKGLLTYPTDLPWQMKSTFIIVINLLFLPRNPLFCEVFRVFYKSVVSMSTRQIIANFYKLRLPVSSKISSNRGMGYY